VWGCEWQIMCTHVSKCENDEIKHKKEEEVNMEILKLLKSL
jgi:hypothetical protein